ncbi:MAG: hypothetical protein GY765_24420 [bacterium]|nr:hypothetical protein [bacterium]
MSMPLEITNNKSTRWVLVMLLLCPLVFCACSAKKHYKVLNFFFDGVPNPEEKEAKEAELRKGSKKNFASRIPQKKWAKMISRHPDYFKNVCNNCHDRSAKNYLKVEKKEDLCYLCHKPEQFTAAFVHGPVAVKACLTCHVPHESQYVKLLKKKPRELCNTCHGQGGIPSKSCVKEKACTQCHYPHAGEKRFFLRGELAAE